MPRFFFNFTDGKRTFTDAIGVQLDGVAAVRKYIALHIHDLKSSLNEKQIQDWFECTVVVENENHKPLLEMDFDLKQKNMTVSVR
jgi:hypothetical protein